MLANSDPRIRRIWLQTTVPAVLRQGKGHKLWVRLPYNLQNRGWLGRLGRASPNWKTTEKHWEVPAAWFDKFVNQALETYGKIYVIQPYREQEKCAPACRTAHGHECQCSCMGANHGSGDGAGWFDVSDTFSFKWGPRELACRLIERR